ncbi:MAG: hypothetical protein PWQ99_1385 [Clostridia bacterium]|nr:hypothetical protein [Clostridia bacterium]MDN5376565.1 hypothetical protein [Thermacetogenium sp.]
MEVRPYLLPVPPYGLGQPTGVEYSPIVKDAGTVDTVCRMCPPSPLTPCSPGSLAHCPCTPCSTFQGHKKTPGTFTCFARGFCYSLCYSLVTVLAENPRNYGGLTETNPALPLIYRTRKPLIFKAFHSIFGGGEGSRTPVRKNGYKGFSERSRCFPFALRTPAGRLSSG